MVYEYRSKSIESNKQLSLQALCIRFFHSVMVWGETGKSICSVTMHHVMWSTPHVAGEGLHVSCERIWRQNVKVN